MPETFVLQIEGRPRGDHDRKRREARRGLRIEAELDSDLTAASCLRVLSLHCKW